MSVLTLRLGSTRHSAVLTLTSLPSGLYLRGALTAGFEPTTSHFAKWGSTRLSYGGVACFACKQVVVRQCTQPPQFAVTAVTPYDGVWMEWRMSVLCWCLTGL